MALSVAMVAVELLPFSTSECCQMLDGTHDGGSGCSVRVHSVCNGIHRSVVIAMAFATVLTPVENFFCDFPSLFQISPVIFVIVFDLQGPQTQDGNFVNLVGITMMCQLGVKASLQFPTE